MLDRTRDGSTAERAIPPTPDTWTGQCPPMTWWPDAIQNRDDPNWSHSGRGMECK